MTAPKKQGKARLVLALSLAAVGGWLGHQYWWGLHHVSSDNAQIEGRIIPIASRVTGFVKEVPIDDHQTVNSGSLLVKIDDKDYAARARQANAELQMAIASGGKQGETGQAGAQLGYAQANAAAAQSSIVLAQANADRARMDRDRYQSLAAKNMASQSQLDAAETAWRASEAQLKTARETASAAGQQITASSAGLRLAQAKIEAAKAARDLAVNQLADTQLLAPHAGMVSKKAVEVGQLVQAGQTLLNLVPNDSIWVIANLKETEIGRVKPGQNVDIEIDAYPGLKLNGKVSSFSPATGAKFSLLPPDNATGNFTKVVQRIPVRIALPASERAKVELRPGMSVVAIIQVG